MKILYENNNYTVTLTTLDEDPLTCTYQVSCTRMDLVTITQDLVDLNKFNVSISSIPDDENVFIIFDFTVTDEDNNDNITQQYVVIEKKLMNDARYYNKLASNDEFVKIIDYQDTDILNKIQNVDGSGSGLNVEFLHGIDPSNLNIPDIVPVSNANGKFTIDWVYYPPTITSLLWDIESHHINDSYTLAITAIDPQGQDLTYDVTCDDPLVGIVQDTSPHIWHVTYGDYEDNTEICLSVKTTNEDGLVDIININKTIIESVGVEPPVIDSIHWDVYNHEESSSYTMTVNATDPQGQTIMYNVTCDDPTVIIVQDAIPNIWHVTYGEYPGSTTVDYTIIVTNEDTLSDTEYDTRPVANVETAPVIDNILWDDYTHEENDSYVMTINAHDPQSQDLTYHVVCDDPAVGVVQSGTPNIWNITYGEYGADTTVVYTITVTNEDLLTDIAIDSKVVSNVAANPIIDDVGWDFDIHDENNSYVMTITAHDPNLEDLTYHVVCNDPTVGVAQSGTPHIWNIIYGEYVEDTIVAYTITVTNESLLIDTEIEIKTVHDTTVLGDRGVFFGGGNIDLIDYITISTLGDATFFGNLSVLRYSFAACSNGTNDRGVIGYGGYYDGGGTFIHLSSMHYVTISTPGNSIHFGNVGVTRDMLEATSNGVSERGLFVGGMSISTVQLDTIEYITISTPGNTIDFGNLIVGNCSFGSTSNGINNRGIFGGGWINGGIINTVQYITISTPGNAAYFGELSFPGPQGSMNLSGCSNGVNERGIFAGGIWGMMNNHRDIRYVTISTLGNTIDFGDLTVDGAGANACSNGISERGIFSPNYTNIHIEYITISTLGNAVHFGELSIDRGPVAVTADA